MMGNENNDEIKFLLVKVIIVIETATHGKRQLLLENCPFSVFVSCLSNGSFGQLIEEAEMSVVM